MNPPLEYLHQTQPNRLSLAGKESGRLPTIYCLSYFDFSNDGISLISTSLLG